VKTKPEAKAYYELSSDLVAFSFPEPGPLEGVKSLTKAVLKTKNVFFQYPTAPYPQVGISLSLDSVFDFFSPSHPNFNITNLTLILSFP
jgi:hypothetical protein